MDNSHAAEIGTEAQSDGPDTGVQSEQDQTVRVRESEEDGLETQQDPQEVEHEVDAEGGEEA